MNKNPDLDKTSELFLQFFAAASLKVRCIVCGAEEEILPLDEPIDELFIANYHCVECDIK
jgi:hypothetical protein